MFIVFTVVGVGWFQTAAGGYGKGAQVKIIGFGVLVDFAPALLLPAGSCRTRSRVHWREETPQMPDELPPVGTPAAPVTGA